MNTPTIIPATRSTIIKSRSIASVLEHIDNHKTLVIFDIDNTILEPVNHMASTQWYNALIQHGKSLGLTELQAYDIIKPVLYDFLHKTPVKAVEPETSTVITSLQQQNIPVMGLTARTHPVVERTIEQLTTIAITLTPTSPVLQNALEINHLPSPHEAAYHEGVIFSGFNPKGIMLKTLMEQAGYLPEKIVFVDDQPKYVASVEKCAAELNIPYVGIHYTHLDEKVNNFILDQESINRCFTAQITL